jgi:NitT/TauT family transport system substrate-binding protein
MSRLVPALLIAVALIITSCAGTATPSPSGVSTGAGTTAAPTRGVTKLRIGVPVAVLPLASPFIAKSKGYFADEGLDVEVSIATGLQCLSGVLSDQFQMCAGVANGLMVAAERNEAALAIAGLEPTVALYLILRADVASRLKITAQSPLKDRLAALNGLTVAVTGVGDAANQALNMMVKEAGLQEKDVKVVAITTQAGQHAAMLEKQVDAVVGGPPGSDVLDVGGIGTIILRSKEISAMSDLLYEVLYTTPKWADANQVAARAAVRAIVKANNYLRTDQGAAAHMNATDWKGISPEVLTISLSRFRQEFSADGCMTAGQATGLVKYNQAVGVLTKTVDATEGVFWTNKYNEACKK